MTQNPEPILTPVGEFLANHTLVLPALLLVAGHRPLAFVLGQLCWASLPLTWLWPSLPLGAWANLLSHPHGPAFLEAYLLALPTAVPSPEPE